MINMTDKLIKLFADVLEVEPSRLNEESCPDTVPEWDSLGAMNLVTAIESEFEVRLSTRDIMNMSSIALAREFLKAKGAEL